VVGIGVELGGRVAVGAGVSEAATGTWEKKLVGALQARIPEARTAMKNRMASERRTIAKIVTYRVSHFMKNNSFSRVESIDKPFDPC
jgi:hypothetical protein